MLWDTFHVFFPGTKKDSWAEPCQQGKNLDFNSIQFNLTFVKPTDKHQYLHSASCHPRHCKTSIAYSQALRLQRICSNDSDFLRHSQVLKKHLVSRGHSTRAVHQAIKKVKSMPRLSVLSEKPTTRDCANKKIPLVTEMEPFKR